MTQLFYASSHLNTTNAPSVGERNTYIYTTWFFDLRAETTYGRTWWPSVSNATRVITPDVVTATALD